MVPDLVASSHAKGLALPLSLARAEGFIMPSSLTIPQIHQCTGLESKLTCNGRKANIASITDKATRPTMCKTGEEGPMQGPGPAPHPVPRPELQPGPKPEPQQEPNVRACLHEGKILQCTAVEMWHTMGRIARLRLKLAI